MSYAKADTDWLADCRRITMACQDDRAWVHSKIDTDVPAPLYTDKQVIEFVRACNEHRCPMYFNVGIYQNGAISPDPVKQLEKLKLDSYT